MTMDIADLIHDLSSDSASEREAASEQLLTMGEAAVAAAVPLVRAVSDSSETVRENAVGALEGIGVPDRGDLHALRGLVHSGKPDVAYWAVTLIGRLGSDAAAAVEDLARALASPASHVRQRAAWALGEVGSLAAPAIPALRTAAQSNDARLARFAQRALDAIR
jgi:HEAT repeat protein